MKNTAFKFALILILATCINQVGLSQTSIFDWMERDDLSIQEIEAQADKIFELNGKVQFSGYKQYSRWLYERKFHLDAKGYFILPEQENINYHKFISLKKNYKASKIIWTELGPDYPSYVGGIGPGIGRITSIAVLPSDTTIIYISSPGGGVWKSTNSGTSWKPLLDNFNSAWMDVFHVCIDPSNAKTIYASLTSGSNTSGVIKSTDEGASWAYTGTGPLGTKKVVVHPKNSNIVLTTASNGIWRSSNAGTNWTKVNTSGSFEDIEFNPSNPNIMYASRRDLSSLLCVWRSKDNGNSWSVISSGITTSGRTLLAVCPADPSIVYAVMSKGVNQDAIFNAIYKSTDTGVTYKLLIKGTPGSGTNFFGKEKDGTGDKGQADYDMAICVNPKNPDEVHIAGLICFKSTNGGINFTAETEYTYPNSTGFIHPDLHALEYVKSTIYTGSDGGIFKSINQGDDWINISSGLGIRQLYRIACSKTNPTVITSGAQDQGTAYRRTNGRWYDWAGGDGMDNVISPTDAGISIGMSQYGNLHKTTNYGVSFNYITAPSTGNWVTPMVMHPTSHDTIYAGWVGIWKSYDGGKGWYLISKNAINTQLTNLAVAPSNPRYIYGTAGSIIYRTKDGGTTWSSVAAYSSISCIFVSATNPEKIWITCTTVNSQVWVSTDMGDNFTDISTGLPALNARTIVVENTKSEGIYVGMNVGVYYHDNTKSGWELYGEGLPLVAINELEIQESSGKLRVATYGRGTWECDLRSNEFCKNPINLNGKNIKLGSVKFSWAKVSSANDYTLEYKESKDTIWSGTQTTTDTTLTVSGLKVATNYDWHVRSNCPLNGNFSNSSIQTTFACSVPKTISADNISMNGAIVRWSKVSGSLNYSIQFKESTASTWSNKLTLTDTFYQLAGLLPFTNYDWRVKVICIFDSANYWQSNFRTSSCSLPESLTSKNLTVSTTLVNWKSVKGATFYTVDNKPTTSSVWSTPVNTADTFLKLYFLTANISYDWRVKTNCSSNSSIANFTAGTTGSQNNEIQLIHTALEVFPNPTDKILNYRFAIQRNMKNIEVFITNIEGQSLFSNTIHHSGGLVSGAVSTENYNSGIYFIRIFTEDSVLTQKFVIAR